MDLIDRLLEHDRWATSQLLEASRELSDAQLDREFDIGLRTLRATFDHMFFNVELWTRAAAGQPTDVFDRDRHSLAALSKRHDLSYDTFAAFARRMRDERRLDDTFGDHVGGHMAFAGMIVHVVLHNAEHRAEIVHILQRLGVPEAPDIIEVDHGLWDVTGRAA